MSHLLLDMWNSEIFERLLPIEESEKPELNVSIVGPLLWADNASTFFEFTSSAELTNSTEVDLNENERKEEPINTDIVDDEILQGRPTRTCMKLGTTTRKVSATQLFQELGGQKGNPSMNPHSLVSPYLYGEQNGPAPNEKQPFSIITHPQVGLVCDIHAHLCDSEVIGLLAGKYDAEKKCLFIQSPFPCTATDRSDDDGSTDVELDAEAEWKAREAIKKLGMQVVGWYHSHPRFRPDPSLTDILNHEQHQCIEHDNTTHIEPFVGLIVSTFDPTLPSFQSHHQWFHVRPYSMQGYKRITYMPMLLEVTYASLISTSISSQSTEQLIEKFDALVIETESLKAENSTVPSIKEKKKRQGKKNAQANNIPPTTEQPDAQETNLKMESESNKISEDVNVSIPDIKEVSKDVSKSFVSLRRSKLVENIQKENSLVSETKNAPINGHLLPPFDQTPSVEVSLNSGVAMDVSIDEIISDAVRDSKLEARSVEPSSNVHSNILGGPITNVTSAFASQDINAQPSVVVAPYGAATAPVSAIIKGEESVLQSSILDSDSSAARDCDAEVPILEESTLQTSERVSDGETLVATSTLQLSDDNEDRTIHSSNSIDFAEVEKTDETGKIFNSFMALTNSNISSAGQEVQLIAAAVDVESEPKYMESTIPMKIDSEMGNGGPTNEIHSLTEAPPQEHSTAKLSGKKKGKRMVLLPPLQSEILERSKRAAKPRDIYDDSVFAKRKRSLKGKPSDQETVDFELAPHINSPPIRELPSDSLSADENGKPTYDDEQVKNTDQISAAEITIGTIQDTSNFEASSTEIAQSTNLPKKAKRKVKNIEPIIREKRMSAKKRFDDDDDFVSFKRSKYPSDAEDSSSNTGPHRKRRLSKQSQSADSDQLDDEDLKTRKGRKKKAGIPKKKANHSGESKAASAKKIIIYKGEGKTFKKKRKDPIYYGPEVGITSLLRDRSKPFTELGRKILFSVAPEYRCLTLCILSLGYYYRCSSYRVELSRKWKDETKLEKLKFSACVWGKYLGLSVSVATTTSVEAIEEGDSSTRRNTRSQLHSSQIDTSSSTVLIPDLVEFLRLCWEEVKAEEPLSATGAVKKRKRAPIKAE